MSFKDQKLYSIDAYRGSKGSRLNQKNFDLDAYRKESITNFLKNDINEEQNKVYENKIEVIPLKEKENIETTTNLSKKTKFLGKIKQLPKNIVNVVIAIPRAIKNFFSGKK